MVENEESEMLRPQALKKQPISFMSNLEIDCTCSPVCSQAVTPPESWSFPDESIAVVFRLRMSSASIALHASVSSF